MAAGTFEKNGLQSQSKVFLIQRVDQLRWGNLHGAVEKVSRQLDELSFTAGKVLFGQHFFKVDAIPVDIPAGLFIQIVFCREKQIQGRQVIAVSPAIGINPVFLL
ncbi:hypothetical protein UF75_4631 [Desulfosporosinus sp. I2]|nr:hypothetical protein UF75_4631 [Desulfosporosinus sp. I2]